VTFVDWDDLHKWALTNRALEMGIPEPVETYSSSPHLFTDLDIPEGTKGRLATAGPARAREPRSAIAGTARGGRSEGGRSGQRSEGSGAGRQRSRTRGASGETPRSESGEPRPEGGGTHDGAGPTRRRRNRTRRPSTDAGTT